MHSYGRRYCYFGAEELQALAALQAATGSAPGTPNADTNAWLAAVSAASSVGTQPHLLLPTEFSVAGMGQGLTGGLGGLGAMGQMGPLGQIGAMGPLGTMGPIGQMGPLGQVGAMGPVGQVGPMGQMGTLGTIGTMGTMGGISSVGQLGPTLSPSVTHPSPLFQPNALTQLQLRVCFLQYSTLFKICEFTRCHTLQMLTIFIFANCLGYCWLLFSFYIPFAL